jgi:hypothetical protein
MGRKYECDKCHMQSDKWLNIISFRGSKNVEKVDEESMICDDCLTKLREWFKQHDD